MAGIQSRMRSISVALPNRLPFVLVRFSFLDHSSVDGTVRQVTIFDEMLRQLTQCYILRHMAVIIDQKQYLTASEILELVGVSRQTLWRWRQEGKVPQGNRYRNRQVIFSPEEVEVICEFANRIEPISDDEDIQLSLFNGPKGVRR